MGEKLSLIQLTLALALLADGGNMIVDVSLLSDATYPKILLSDSVI